MPDLMIYGAYGFTGRLLAERASLERHVLLAGRDARRLAALSQQLHAEYRAFEATDLASAVRALAGVEVLLNAAGPFASTALPLLRACLQTGTHYLDVSGELDVIHQLHAHHDEARTQGIVVLPSVGFLALGTDSLAAHTASQLPGAQTLLVAVSRPQSLAAGSLRTMARLVDREVAVRRAGRVERVPVGLLRRRFDLGAGHVECTAISGVETLLTFLTTGVPQVEVYAPASSLERALYRLTSRFTSVVQMPTLQRGFASLSKLVPTPSLAPAHRQVAVALAETGDGRCVARRLVAPSAYQASCALALLAIEQTLSRELTPGFRTPGSVCSLDRILALPGFRLEALLPPAPRP